MKKALIRNSIQGTEAQRAVGWCETAERMFGTRLGAAVQNLLYNKKKVDTDGIPAVTKGRI